MLGDCRLLEIDDVGHTLMQYLSNINTRHRILFANMPAQPGISDYDNRTTMHMVGDVVWEYENAMEDMLDDQDHIGRPLPSFDVRSSNCVEGEIHKALVNVERSTHPLIGLQNFIESLVLEGIKRYEVAQKRDNAETYLPVTIYAGSMEKIQNEISCKSTLKFI